MDDHFPIRLDVEEKHLGSVLKQLNSMTGVANIHLQLGAVSPTSTPVKKAVAALQQMTVKPPAVSPKGSKHMGSNVRQLIARALKKGAMHSKILGEILERSGLSPFSVASAITKMAADKSVVRVGPGTYRLTPLGERRYLTEGRLHKSMSNGPPTNNKAGVRFLILSTLAERKLTHQGLVDLLLDNNYARNNMYGIVHKLRQEGSIRRTDDDYEITEAGRNSIQAQTLEDGPPQGLTQIEHHGEAT